MEFAVEFCMSSENIVANNVFILIKCKTYGKGSYMNSNFIYLILSFSESSHV